MPFQLPILLTLNRLLAVFLFLADVSLAAQVQIHFDINEQDPNAIEIARVQEVYHLSDLYGDKIWPGFNIREIPILINRNGDEELLFGHPNPPAGFRSVKSSGSEDINVMVRDGVTFPYIGTIGDVGGECTALVAPPCYDGSTEDYLTLLVHECFHVFQGRVRECDNCRDWEPVKYIPQISAMIGLESQILRSILNTKNDDQARKLAKMFVAARHERRRNSNSYKIRSENEYEFSEGTATYAQTRLCQLLAETGGVDPIANIHDPDYHGFINAAESYRKELAHITTPTHGIYTLDHCSYWNGMALCYVLDRLHPGWKEDVREKGATLFTLFEQEFPLSHKEEKSLLATAKKQFRYDDLLKKQKKTIDDHIASIRGFLFKPGIHYRIIHQKIRHIYQYRVDTHFYDVPSSVVEEISATFDIGKNSIPIVDLYECACIQLKGIPLVEMEGLKFESKDVPIIHDMNYLLEWVDPDPDPDGSNLTIEFDRYDLGIYHNLQLTTHGFSLKADRARIEIGNDLIEIHALPR